MSRSLKKGPHIDASLYNKVEKAIEKNEKRAIKTYARSCTVIPDFIGMNFLVYNGQKFIPVFVTEDMVGHKLGEFVPTRNFRGHAGDKKSK